MEITSAAALGSWARRRHPLNHRPPGTPRLCGTPRPDARPPAGRAGVLFFAALVTVTLLLAEFVPVTGARAEDGPQFSELVVTMLPEYDQPRILVIFRGELPADTPMPLKTLLRLPNDANVTNTCSLKSPGDEQICAPSTSQPEGDYQIVTYDLTTPLMYVEYYYGAFSGAGARSANLSFWPPYPAKNLELAIPVPTDATDFNVSPAPTRTANDQGAKHYIYDFENVPSGTPINLALTYSRPTDEPWSPPPQQDSATALDPNDDGGLPSDAILFLALAAALSVAFLGYNTLGRRVRFDLGLAKAPRPEEVGPHRTRPAATYCRHCGTPLRQGTGYCSSCGSEVSLISRKSRE